jgi:hypothetical protein
MVDASRRGYTLYSPASTEQRETTGEHKVTPLQSQGDMGSFDNGS